MTYFIIGITVIVSFIAFSNPDLFGRLSFNPWMIRERKQSWRFITHGFIHVGWAHLFINMFVLFSFGRMVETSFEVIFGTGKGLFHYALLYFGAILFSSLLDFGKQKHNPNYDAVGASGAVAAVVFASIILSPKSTLFIFPLPIPIPAFIFGILYLAYSAYMGKRGGDNIGHNAHFLGAVYGVLLTIILEPALVGMFFRQFGG
jgi:membrane associated rhomboid family serine protease